MLYNVLLSFRRDALGLLTVAACFDSTFVPYDHNPESDKHRHFRDYAETLMTSGFSNKASHGRLITLFRSPALYSVATFAGLKSVFDGAAKSGQRKWQFEEPDYLDFDNCTRALCALVTFLCHRFHKPEPASGLIAKIRSVTLLTVDFTGLRVMWETMLIPYRRLPVKEKQLVPLLDYVAAGIAQAPCSELGAMSLSQMFSAAMDRVTTQWTVNHPGDDTAPSVEDLIGEVVTALTFEVTNLRGLVRESDSFRSGLNKTAKKEALKEAHRAAAARVTIAADSDESEPEAAVASAPPTDSRLDKLLDGMERLDGQMEQLRIAAATTGQSAPSDKKAPAAPRDPMKAYADLTNTGECSTCGCVGCAASKCKWTAPNPKAHASQWLIDFAKIKVLPITERNKIATAVLTKGRMRRIPIALRDKYAAQMEFDVTLLPPRRT
jgi:hypothetical protein